MMKVYLFKKSHYADVISEQFWTGKWASAGGAAVSSDKANARAFDSKREAYDIGGIYPELSRFYGGWR